MAAADEQAEAKEASEADSDKAPASQKSKAGTSAGTDDAQDGDWMDRAAHLFNRATQRMEKEYFRTGTEKQFTTLADFERMPRDQKRMVVIGCTGAGKSTLLNRIAGNECKQNDSFEYKWTQDPPLFHSESSTKSVTSLTSFANVRFFGDPDRLFTVVDTPGHDDTVGDDVSKKEVSDKLEELAADLHNKLKAMGRVHTILVIHNDPISNRLNPATETILKMVNEKFAKAHENVWECVVLAYSKCDADTKNWRADMEPYCKPDKLSKQKQMQQQIREKFANCETDVPVLCLSGVTADPLPANVPDPSGMSEFERLWKFMAESKGVETGEIQPFEGLASRFQAVIAEKDRQQALLDAMEAQNTVVLSFFALLVFVMWRAVFVPRMLSIFVLDLPGPLDDLLLFVGLGKFLGFTKVMLSMHLFYKQWLKSRVEETLVQAGLMKAEKAKEA